MILLLTNLVFALIASFYILLTISILVYLHNSWFEIFTIPFIYKEDILSMTTLFDNIFMSIFTWLIEISLLFRYIYLFKSYFSSCFSTKVICLICVCTRATNNILWLWYIIIKKMFKMIEEFTICMSKNIEIKYS